MTNTRTQGRMGGRFTRSRRLFTDDGAKINSKHDGMTRGAFGNSSNRSKKSIGSKWLKKGAK